LPVYDAALAQAIQETTDPALDVAADAYARQLSKNLRRGSRSGVRIDSGPAKGFRRSAEGEYPQREYGDLRDSVASWKEAEGVYAVGFDNAPEQAYYLEGLKPDGGTRASNAPGVRFPLTRTMESVDGADAADAALGQLRR
jgi:hypothetical protein